MFQLTEWWDVFSIARLSLAFLLLVWYWVESIGEKASWYWRCKVRPAWPLVFIWAGVAGVSMLGRHLHLMRSNFLFKQLLSLMMGLAMPLVMLQSSRHQSLSSFQLSISSRAGPGWLLQTYLPSWALHGILQGEDKGVTANKTEEKV